jgi:hypothetical protein
MIVAMVVTAGKQKSRFGVSHASDIVCFPVFNIRINSWLGLIGYVLTARMGRITDTCCFCPHSVCADFYQRCLPSHSFAT